MPRFDGTGPFGRGPLTGRGMGRCNALGSALGRKSLVSLAVPLVGMVLNDARKPEGLTRRLYRALRSYAARKLDRSRAAVAVPEGESSTERNTERLLSPSGRGKETARPG